MESSDGQTSRHWTAAVITLAVVLALVGPMVEPAWWQLVSGLPKEFLVASVLLGLATVACVWAAEWQQRFSPLLLRLLGAVCFIALVSGDLYAVMYHYQPSPAVSPTAALDSQAIEKLAAKQEQNAAVDWQRLKPFQISDLTKQFSAIGKYPVAVVWGSDDSAYGIAADVGNACHVAQWSGCTPDKLPDSMEVFGMGVHWRAGYQPIAKAIADSLHDVIGVPISAAPVAEPSLKAPLEVWIGRKPL
jgi:hypothetical protein